MSAASHSPEIRRWTIVFAAVSLVTVAAGYLLFWAVTGFTDFDLGLAGNVAVILGSILLSALGVGLMALMFYSDTSGRDAEVGGVQRDREE